MANNKIIFNGKTLIDLTNDTVTADKLASGVTAHDKAGNLITGTMSSGGGDTTVITGGITGSGSTSISITGLSSMPKMFAIELGAQTTLSTTRVVASVVGYNYGGSIRGLYLYQQKQNGWGICYYSSSYYSYTYSNGTLTIRSTSSTNGGVFKGNYIYQCTY